MKPEWKDAPESVHALPDIWRNDVLAHERADGGMSPGFLAGLKCCADELDRALRGAVPVAWQYLGTSSLAGPWPHPEWRICDEHEAAAAAGFEVRPLYTAPPAPAANSRLYHAVNRMMAVVCSEGEIRNRTKETEEVMDALAEIDGGTYTPAPAASVPDGPPTITKKVCKGCPHLKTKWWRDDLDNDETDSGTSATCTLADKHITAYWRDNDSPPTWCPLNVPKPTTPEPTHADDR